MLNTITRTLRLRLKDKHAALLCEHARAVNARGRKVSQVLE
jgi:hypothetical protein